MKTFYLKDTISLVYIYVMYTILFSVFDSIDDAEAFCIQLNSLQSSLHFATEVENGRASPFFGRTGCMEGSVINYQCLLEAYVHRYLHQLKFVRPQIP